MSLVCCGGHKCHTRLRCLVVHQAAAEKKAAEIAAAKAKEEEQDRELYSNLKKKIKKLKKERDACDSTKAGREEKKSLKKQIKQLEQDRDEIKRRWDAAGDDDAGSDADDAVKSSPKRGGRKDGKLSNKERRRLEKETADEREAEAQVGAGCCRLYPLSEFLFCVPCWTCPCC